jgi:hypothetical protein
MAGFPESHWRPAQRTRRLMRGGPRPGGGCLCWVICGDWTTIGRSGIHPVQRQVIRRTPTAAFDPKRTSHTPPGNDRLSEGLTALHPPVGMCHQGGRSADTPHVLRRSFASLAPIFDQPPVCVSYNHEGWSYSLSELIMAATEEQGHLTPPLRQHALPILLDAANLAKPPCVTR